MSLSIVAKRGDTFTLTCTRTDSAGSAVDLSGVTIGAEMRLGATTITPTATITDAAAGEFKLTATAATAETWTVGAYKCDIEFTDIGGNVISTETFYVVIDPDITNAA